MGHVRLFAWPSGELVSKWPAWVEDFQTIVVDGAGRMIWVSLDSLSGPYPKPAPVLPALMAATPSQSPRVLATVTDHPWDLSLVGGEIRAQTADGAHRPIRIPLSGPDAGRVLPLEFPFTHVGTMWWSPDGQWAVGSDDGTSSSAVVLGPAGIRRGVELSDSPRTFALTPDRATLVTAYWVAQSTMTDVGTGVSRPILEKRQRWIVVSERGDVAWATDNHMPNRRPCVAPLAGF
ncbi:MAG: hypothetical protein M3N29_03650 [Chloroflexota bacterium]|nr:hypothetical protein [Chloroflexota bacterium]